MLLQIKNLTVGLNEQHQRRTILDAVSFDIQAQSIVGLVGGSGSGKTTTGLAILRLLSSGLEIERGEILLNNQDLLKYSAAALQQIRGKRIAMIFQEPLVAFNPVFTIGYQIEEVLMLHDRLESIARKKKVIELLSQVGIKQPERIKESYPHQLSGGLRQRAMIAHALAGEPELLIADEPTSNLDVTVQAKIIELFKAIQLKNKLSILLITHDLGMVGHLADEIVVLRKGKVVEKGPCRQILKTPLESYTQELLKAY